MANMGERGRFSEGGVWRSYGQPRSPAHSYPPRTLELGGKPFVAWDVADPRVKCLQAAPIYRSKSIVKGKPHLSALRSFT